MAGDRHGVHSLPKLSSEKVSTSKTLALALRPEKLLSQIRGGILRAKVAGFRGWGQGGLRRPFFAYFGFGFLNFSFFFLIFCLPS